MKRCRCGQGCLCIYVTNGAHCTLPEDEYCINQEEVEDMDPIVGIGKHSEVSTIAAGCNIKVNDDDKNKIKINCDEITLTKDSVGIEVNIKALIQNIDKFETIEINGRVFKRVREE